MTQTLHAGYVPLLDAAPLLLADAFGFAEEEGLHLQLHAAPSWANLRDLLAFGKVDAAHMLAPLPIAIALGLAGSPAQLEALSVLNLNGNVIGVSQTLAARLAASGHSFDFADAASAGRALLAASQTLRIGVPFAFSMHTELLHYWLGGLGAATAQLEICTLPPARMAEALVANEIDAFCVGEPWGSVAVDLGAATLLLPGSAIWASAPEKVLAARKGWAEAEPDLAGKLLRAVWRAGRWLGQPENHMLAAERLVSSGLISVAPEVLERALAGRMIVSHTSGERISPRLIDFSSQAANFPWRSQAAWIGAQMGRQHGLDPAKAAQLATSVFRSDLYRLHVRATGADLPGASEKLEGALALPTLAAAERGQLILPQDRFFDARIFDPAGVVS